MSDDEVIPMQESMFPDLAPAIPMMPVPRKFGAVHAYASPAWRMVRTTGEGTGWHLIRRVRGGDRVVTVCGIAGRRVEARAAAFVPCPTCLAFAEGAENAEGPPAA
jgi:hypothetical protein